MVCRCVKSTFAAPFRGWRGQPHRPPTLTADCEDTGERGSVDNRQICPVLDVVSEVVHIDCSRIQGMAKAYEEAVAAILRGIEDAIREV
jgi:hypothetical protein